MKNQGNNKKRNVAIYGRVSSEKETQLSAFRNQLDWYDEQVHKNPNWNVIDKYYDEGITGVQAKNRGEFLRMLEDAKHHKFDLIVTREVSRFARNTVETLQFVRELTKLGIEVFFIEDMLSTFDEAGETRLTNMAAMAQEESRKLSVRVKVGQHIARKEKQVIYGNGNILGYNKVDKQFIVNQDEAETVRLVYKLYLEGNGLKKIKNELTSRGRKNSSGIVKWSENVVAGILDNPFYKKLSHI